MVIIWSIDWINDRSDYILAIVQSISGCIQRSLNNGRNWFQGPEFQRYRCEARLREARRKWRQRLRGTDPGQLCWQVESHLLLSEGLHLRLPDRDRRIRPPRQGIRGP